MNAPRQANWTPPPRPDWLARVNEEGRGMDLASLVPLRPAELIATAMANTGLSDFGKDEWREPFEVLLKAIDDEADLNLFGRLMTRSDLLIWLEERLAIEDRGGHLRHVRARRGPCGPPPGSGPRAGRTVGRRPGRC